MIQYIFASIMPLLILICIVSGVIAKKNVFALFIDGVNEGLKVTLKVFPHILGITIAVSLLRDTKALEVLLSPICSLLEKSGVPQGIVPIAFFRSISGGASMTMLIDTIENYGVNSKESKMATIIMAGSETTIYVITMLFAAGKITKGRGVIVAGLTADVIAVLLAIILINMNWW